MSVCVSVCVCVCVCVCVDLYEYMELHDSWVHHIHFQ